MNSREEIAKLEKTADVYASEDLAGANLLYHVHLRDSIIPEEGGRSALELGCGTGLWTGVLCQRYEVVDVVDGSSRLLEQVLRANRGRKAELTTHNKLLEDFRPAAGRNWEHVYMTFLLEHLSNPVAALSQAKNWLARKGCLFLAVPNADSLHRAIALRMGLIEKVDQLSDCDRQVGHRRVYTWELLRSQVASAGLKIVAQRPVGLKVVSLRQMENWPSEMVRAFCASGDLCPANAAYIVILAGHP